MDMNKFQLLAGRTIPKDMKVEDVKRHALFGMASETGEILGLHQKTYQGHPINEAHAKKEVGDLLWFIAEYCSSNGWTMNDIASMNIEKLLARYPNGFEVERSLEREAGDV